MIPETLPDAEAPLSLSQRAVQFVYGCRRKVATAAAGALVCVLAYHVVFGANGFTAYEAKRHQTAQMAVQIEALKNENEKLADHNARLQTDKGVIEESIRTQLHFARPDEVIVTVPETPAPAAQ